MTIKNSNTTTKFSRLNNTTDDDDDDDDNNNNNNNNEITVILLDAMQQRFPITLPHTATLAQLKQQGSTIHHVPPSQQRLIFMGRMLKCDDDDDDVNVTLKDLRIQDQMVVHLYPKPNIVTTATCSTSCAVDDADADTVITSTTIDNTNTNTNTNTNNTSNGGGGAHIPNITIDSTHPSVRHHNGGGGSDNNGSSIVPTIEIFESAQRIKMVSFILLIITTMELLTLFTIYLGDDSSNTDTDTDTSSNGDGVPHDPGDPTDYEHNKSPYDNTTDGTTTTTTMRPWRNSDYIDLCINIAGFYVGLLGLKVSRGGVYRVALARRFLVCLMCVGCAWIGYYYWMDLRQERELLNDSSSSDQDDDKDDDDDLAAGNLYENAFFAVLIPAMVWTSCFHRAWEYQHLLAEAENEVSATQELILNSNAAAAAAAFANNNGNHDGTTRTLAVVTTERNRDGIERLAVPSGAGDDDGDDDNDDDNDDDYSTNNHRNGGNRRRNNSSSSLEAELL